MKIYEVYLLCTFLSSATEKFFKKIFKITIDFLSWSIKAIKVISVKRILSYSSNFLVSSSSSRNLSKSLL